MNSPAKLVFRIAGAPVRLLDKIAGKWLDFRTFTHTKNSADPDLKQFYIQRIEAKEDHLDIWGTAPGLCILADEAAALMEKSNAINYFSFKALPRHDHPQRPVLVTVQWGDGLSPAEKNAQLMAENRALTLKNADLEALIDKYERADSVIHSHQDRPQPSDDGGQAH
jgi:hypothetical protein